MRLKETLGSLSLATALLAALGCRGQEKTAAPEEDSTPPAVEALRNDEAPVLTQPLSVGAQVFDFQGLAHNGQMIRLSSFLDKPVVVYFCPRNRDAGCTDLAVGLREGWLRLNAHLSMVFAVNQEPTTVHRDFAAEHVLPHLLLTDPSGRLHGTFGIAPGTLTSYLIGTDRQVLWQAQPAGGAAFVQQLERALTDLGLLQTPYPI